MKQSCHTRSLGLEPVRMGKEKEKGEREGRGNRRGRGGGARGPLPEDGAVRLG